MKITLDAPDAAGSETAVVFACDANYLPFAAFAAAQIARLAASRGAEGPQGRGFDIVIASPERPDLPASLAPARLRACGVGTGGAFAGLGLDARRTEASYLRLALPEAFAGEYRRILYLDADVFVQGGDFAALLDLDIAPHALAAVRDNMQWRTPTRRPPAFARLGLATAPYLNSGVLLIDVAAFRGQDVLGRCLAFARRHPPERIGLDQDLLNCVLRGEWAELGPVWNWQYTWASRLFEAMVGANVVHFIGPRKPWRHEGGELPLKFRRAYAAFLAEHFSAAALPAGDGVPPHRNRGFLRRSLVKHLIATGAMCNYLDRFDGDLAVLR